MSNDSAIGTPPPGAAPPYVARIRSVLWPNLPTLLVSSAAVCAAATVALVLVPSLTPVSVVLWTLVVAPVFGALVAQANDMVLGGEPRTFSIAAYIRRTGRLSLSLSLPPAVTAACSLVAVDVWVQTRSALALGPAAVGAVCTALLAVAAVAALPIGCARPELRGMQLTLTALRVAARAPVPVFAVAGLFVAAVSTSAHVAASLMFCVPGPLALVLVAGVWTSAEASGLRPGERDD